MTLRKFVVDYPLPIGVLTEAQWQEAFLKFKREIAIFKLQQLHREAE